MANWPLCETRESSGWMTFDNPGHVLCANAQLEVSWMPKYTYNIPVWFGRVIRLNGLDCCCVPNDYTILQRLLQQKLIIAQFPFWQSDGCRIDVSIFPRTKYIALVE